MRADRHTLQQALWQGHGVDVSYTMLQGIAMLESGAVDPTPITTHILSVSRISEGVQAVNTGPSVKVMVTPE